MAFTAIMNEILLFNVFYLFCRYIEMKLIFYIVIIAIHLAL